MYVDGTMGARTAALTFEYADCPGEMGSLIFSQNELNEFVTECYLRHLQLSLYTIGDRAISTQAVLSLLQTIEQRTPESAYKSKLIVEIGRAHV